MPAQEPAPSCNAVVVINEPADSEQMEAKLEAVPDKENSRRVDSEKLELVGEAAAGVNEQAHSEV